MALPDGFPSINFDHYHQVELPRALVGTRATHVERASRGLTSLAFRVGNATYTYQPTAAGIDIISGESAAETVLQLDPDSWQGLVHELEAPAGLLYAGRVTCRRGNAVDLMSWESALRALYNGRPPYDPHRLDLRDRAEAPLDPQRTFTTHDDSGDMAHFLRVVGYLFVRDVFSAAEVTAMLAEAQVLRTEARKGDKLSWWGRNAEGEEVLCRVTRGITKPHLATLRDDGRLLALKDLAPEPMVFRVGEGEGVTVIYKQPNMTEGLSDLPWHRDCGMGGHAVMCPLLIASVYLTEASPETGELRMLPGSHHAAFNAHDPILRDLPAAHFHGRPGDVSLHYGDTVHGAPPPTDAQRSSYRISAVVGYAHPDARHHRGDHSYNDVLHRRDDGQIEHLIDVAKSASTFAGRR